ncbi:CRISPR-associated endonuclease Cas2 [Rhodovulum sp. PH10]|uniref:CRISPR-associated endonuclease Cas2 n=1 Tax=Rhodovulum sp. PH10 TaxID=1187851 RepID=UPI00058B0F57|nr:CRISPR-associated endonuclease Cas2 [Rhodovulum sp. PH10]
MSRGTHLYVFAYDIERDRARARVAKLLENDLVRVQKSVFEGRMTPAAARRIAEKIERELAPTDSLRVYAITAQGLDASRSFGMAPIAEKSAFLLF